jgi:hypothetical protein
MKTSITCVLVTVNHGVPRSSRGGGAEQKRVSEALLLEPFFICILCSRLSKFVVFKLRATNETNESLRYIIIKHNEFTLIFLFISLVH